MIQRGGKKGLFFIVVFGVVFWGAYYLLMFSSSGKEFSAVSFASKASMRFMKYVKYKTGLLKRVIPLPENDAAIESAGMCSTVKGVYMAPGKNINDQDKKGVDG